MWKGSQVFARCLLYPIAARCCTGFPQTLVVSRKMEAIISYGCSSMWVTKGCFQCSSPSLMSLAWSLSEFLIKRDSSFGRMDPKDHWDLGCLRCSQMGPERGWLTQGGQSRDESSSMWDHSALYTKVSKLITSRGWSFPGEEQDYHESAQSSYLRHELYFSTQSALGWTRMPPVTIQDGSAGRHLQEQSSSPSSLPLSWHFLPINILQNSMSRH